MTETEPSQGRPFYTKKLLVASGNKNKIRELQAVADEYGLELLGPDEAAQLLRLPPPPEVDEIYDTYFENALVKAQAYADWSGMPAVGDDSGLEVTALGGRPGVFSARYAGEEATDGDRIAKLLSELGEAGRSDRTAYFCCTLVLSYPGGALLHAEAAIRGVVLDEPRGQGGFGYDPIILIDSLGQTLAEVDFDVTCRCGFRGKAARRLFSALEKLRVSAGNPSPVPGETDA